MYKYYHDYYWKSGKPYGIKEVTPSQSSFSYKIVSDPYHKRLSIEKYHHHSFDKVIYDSSLLDFRHLTLKDQIAWQREVIKEDKDQSTCILRNQDDRAVLIEKLTFENHQCRICEISSIHGIPLSVHRMYYRAMKDSFDGVILFDSESRPIMMKKYEIDPLTGEFTQLISEEWEIKDKNIH